MTDLATIHANEIIAIVDRETNASKYATMLRTADAGIPLARAIVKGYALATDTGAEILAETVEYLRAL